MADVKQHTYKRTRHLDDGGEVVETEVNRSSSDEPARRVQSIIMTIVGAIAGILTLRFLLVLFGANPANAFANFIYDLTQPLVAPFQGLFGIDTTIEETGSRLEIETLVAIVVYYLIGWLIIRLLDSARSNPPEV